MRINPLISSLVALAVPAAAVFNATTHIYAQNGVNVTVSLVAAVDTKDLFFKLSFPTAYDWIAVGIGAKMQGAFTLMAYPAKDGKSMTLSPRTADGNSEPVYNKDIDCKIVGDSNPNLGDQVVFGVICRNGAKWSNPPLDFNATKAPFMWALGRQTFNNGSLWSNDPAAPLRGHSAAAKFTMDMTLATISSNPDSDVPVLGNKTYGASEFADITTTSNYKSPAHAIAIIVALVVLVPIDSILRMCIKTVKFHMFMSVLVSILFFVGIGLGFSVSGLYNRSKHYNSAHQVIGLIVFILYIGQIPLGWFSYRRQLAAKAATDSLPADQSQLPSRPPSRRNILASAHIIIGSLLVILAIVNGSIGWNFGLVSGYTRPWAIVVVGMFIVWLGVYGIRWMWAKRKEDDHEDDEEEYRRKIAMATQSYQMQNMQGQNAHPGEAQYPTVSIPRSY